MSRFYSWAICIGALFATCEDALAQVCKPVAERSSELGCWIIAAEPVGNLSKSQAFWHLDVYLTSAAAKLAKTPSSTVVEAFGKTWLLTIADTGWRPEGGERVAEIGPLPVIAGETYAVQYMEAVFAPGMTAPSHTHAGPEAWYTLSGETCLETPDGKQIGRAGGEPVPISRQNSIAVIRSTSVPIFTATATGSSASSTGSSNAVALQYATTNWLPTTLHSSSLRRSGCGYALISPRPNLSDGASSLPAIFEAPAGDS